MTFLCFVEPVAEIAIQIQIGKILSPSGIGSSLTRYQMSCPDWIVMNSLQEMDRDREDVLLGVHIKECYIRYSVF